MEPIEEILYGIVLGVAFLLIAYGLLNLRGTGLLQSRLRRCPICKKQLRFWQTKGWATFGAEPAVHEVIGGQYWIHAPFVKCHNKCAIESGMGDVEIAERIRENERDYDYDSYTFTHKSRQEDDLE